MEFTEAVDFLQWLRINKLSIINNSDLKIAGNYLQSIASKNFIKSDVGSSFSLDELEKKLNEALNNETPESLTQWIKEKRK